MLLLCRNIYNSRLQLSITKLHQLNGSVKELNTFHNYETENITPKASDVAENLQLYRVVRFFRPRSSSTHLMLFSERPPIYASCMMISGRRTEHVIIGFLLRHWLYEWFLFAENVCRLYASCLTISGGRMEQHVIIGFGELAAVNYNT